jgi:hypothetical protein
VLLLYSSDEVMLESTHMSCFVFLFSPAGEPLNDANAGTGTSTTEWIDLVIGEGGVIDWISPGWRGEYKR